MLPSRIDPDGTNVFTSDQVDDYGDPCLYGYTKYIVIESRNLHYVTDYHFEQERLWVPVHRYDRVARFKHTLLTLLGEKNNIPTQVLAVVKTFLKDDKDIWNDTRRILKHYKFSKFYNQIPSILRLIGYPRCFPQITANKLEDILNDFKIFVSKYDQLKQKFKRNYFPNLRYIALKLLELHSIKSIYNIPFIRTKRKNKVLNMIWDTVIN